MRTIKVTLHEILSLISCAGDYGFEDDILFDAFKNILDGKLSLEEIEYYALAVLNSDGYGQEDYEEIKARLIDFKNKYCS